MIIFPKNKFHQLVSNTFEKCLPGLQYFIYNPITRWSREMGFTEQEKILHNFWRGGNIMYHAYTQAIHPMGYLERNRADNQYRRVTTFLPGVELPDWAQHNKRAVDFDFEGAINPFRAQNIIEQEATPHPHYGWGYPTSICHVGNWRWMAGYWAQRFFFNENKRGNINKGYYTEKQKTAAAGWYADQEGNENLRFDNNQDEVKNAKKWVKNIDQFFPDYAQYEVPKETGIIKEPYLQRTADDVTVAAFIQKWSDAIKNKTFSMEEIQNIYSFYVQERDDVFWSVSQEDGKYYPTELYTKFVQALNVPNIFELKKFTAKVVEEQYRESWIIKNNVTLLTIEAYRRQHSAFNAELNALKIVDSLMAKRLRSLITEEVYNPMFRSKLAEEAQGATGSFVVHLYKANKPVDKIEEVSHEIKDNLHIINRDVHARFLERVRKVITSFTFKDESAKKF
jgi:hypothetical protein